MPNWNAVAASASLCCSSLMKKKRGPGCSSFYCLSLIKRRGKCLDLMWAFSFSPVQHVLIIHDWHSTCDLIISLTLCQYWQWKRDGWAAAEAAAAHSFLLRGKTRLSLIRHVVPVFTLITCSSTCSHSVIMLLRRYTDRARDPPKGYNSDFLSSILMF